MILALLLAAAQLDVCRAPNHAVVVTRTVCDPRCELRGFVECVRP